MEMKLLRNVDGYSFYDNPDIELVEKILAFPPPKTLNDLFTFNNRLDWKLKEVTPNQKYLMESTEGDLMTLDFEKYEKLLNRTHLKNINETFLVSDTFNKYFAPIKNDSSIILGMTDKYLNLPMRKETFYCGVNSIFVSERWDVFHYSPKYYNGTTSHELSFTLGSDNGNGHMYFTAQGEIANRDYNNDLNQKLPFISKEDAVQDYISKLRNLVKGKVEKTSKYYFCNGYAIIIIERFDDSWDEKKLELSFIPEVLTDTYYIQGESGNKIKKPKKGVSEIDKEDFINTISELLNKIIQENEKND